MRPEFLLSLALLATPTLAEVPAIVADTPVTASLVQQVMGDLGQRRCCWTRARIRMISSCAPVRRGRCRTPIC